MQSIGTHKNYNIIQISVRKDKGLKLQIKCISKSVKHAIKLMSRDKQSNEKMNKWLDQ